MRTTLYEKHSFLDWSLLNSDEVSELSQELEMCMWSLSASCPEIAASSSELALLRYEGTGGYLSTKTKRIFYVFLQVMQTENTVNSSLIPTSLQPSVPSTRTILEVGGHEDTWLLQEITNSHL